MASTRKRSEETDEDDEEECTEYPAITKPMSEVLREQAEQRAQQQKQPQPPPPYSPKQSSSIVSSPRSFSDVLLKKKKPQSQYDVEKAQAPYIVKGGRHVPLVTVTQCGDSSESSSSSRSSTSQQGAPATPSAPAETPSKQPSQTPAAPSATPQPTSQKSMLEESFTESFTTPRAGDEEKFSLLSPSGGRGLGPRMSDVRKYSVVNPQIPLELQREINSHKKCDLCQSLLVLLSYILIILTLPFSLLFCIKVVAEYERTVIFRLGRILTGGAKGPGLFFVLPCLDMMRTVDLRTVTFDVPPQEVLTKDSVTVAVDAVVYYRIYNPVVAITNVEDVDRSTRLLAATTLRNVLGTKNLAEILSERESISSMMQSMLDDATDPWGVKVERVEVKDVRLPVQLQRAMAAEAEATREARAKVIAAEGEQKASKALREASRVISESPFALQLRYLQTLSTISAEKNSTIIFPMPVDLLSRLLVT